MKGRVRRRVMDLDRRLGEARHQLLDPTDALDFSDWRALQPMFDAAKKAGLFIVLRPG